MTLPKINAPEYSLVVPSTQVEVKYRPFLVKEEKLLLIAQETGDEKSLYGAIKNLIHNCCHGQLDVDTMPLFDVEYVFLQLRSKSVGESVTLKLRCPDDEKTFVDKTIKLDEIAVHMTADHTNEVQITDKIKIVMKYPVMEDMKGIDISAGISGTFGLISKCVHEIHDEDMIHSRIDMNEKELDEFIDTLDSQQFDRLMNFFQTMPKLRHVIEIVNPKTKKKGEVMLEGLDSFLG